MEDDELVPVFIPSLATVLLNFERKKGSVLSSREVLSIRDSAIVMMMRRSMAAELAARRGYDDIDPENCYEDYLLFREELADLDDDDE